MPNTTKTRRAPTLWLATTIIALSTLLSLSAAALPTIDTPVVDDAGVLSVDEIDRISAKLYDHHEKTGVQMAVLVVDTTDGQPIEDYSLAVAEEWAGGDASRDDGILLTFAVDDRQNRLELGYGVEGFIPDSVAQRMLNGATDLLRQEEYGQAAEQIVDQVIARTDMLRPGEERPDVLTPGWVLVTSLWLFLLAMFQTFFWTARRGTLHGIEIDDESEQGDEDDDESSNRLALLLPVVASIFVPLIAVAFLLRPVYEDTEIDVGLYAPEMMFTWIMLVPILLGGLLALTAIAIPKTHKKPSLLFTIAWWAVPAVATGYLLLGLELPPYWDVPLTSTALVWAVIVWLAICGSGLVVFPNLNRPAAIAVMFVLHLAVIGYPVYLWALETDLLMLTISGSIAFCMNIFFWLFLFLTGANYRTSDTYRQTYGMSGNSYSSGGGGSTGFSSGSSGGFSGGGGSFGGGGASGSW